MRKEIENGKFSLCMMLVMGRTISASIVESCRDFLNWLSVARFLAVPDIVIVPASDPAEKFETTMPSLVWPVSSVRRVLQTGVSAKRMDAVSVSAFTRAISDSCVASSGDAKDDERVVTVRFVFCERE